MRKKFLAGLATGALVLGLAGTSMASTFNYTDFVDPQPDILLTTFQSYSFTFDITDDSNWSIPGQTFDSGSIKLNLTDDRNDPWYFSVELGAATLDGQLQPPFLFDAGQSQHFALTAGLISDGKVNVTLYDVVGDFKFKDATLYATFDAPNPVPEPATMALLGTGLVGLVGMRRKKKD